MPSTTSSSGLTIVFSMKAGGVLYVEELTLLPPPLKKGDIAEARFRMYELRFSSIGRSTKLLRVDAATRRMLRLFSAGIVTLGVCFCATGGCGRVEGAVENVLVHRAVVLYELVLRGRRKDDREKLVLLRDGEYV